MKEEAVKLKESGEGYAEGLKERKGKGGML